MPRKKKKQLPLEEEPESKEKVDDSPSLGLTSDTGRGIVIIVLFLLVIISLLSFFQVAGPIGQLLEKGMIRLFGRARYILPVIFFLLAYVFLFPNRYHLKVRNYIGTLLVLFTVSGFLHLWVPLPETLKVVPKGVGGGYLGVFVSWPLLQALGVWASAAVLVAFFLVGLLLAFNTSLDRLAGKEGWLGWLMRRLYVLKEGIYEWLSRRGDSGEDEDDEGQEPSDSEKPAEHSFGKRELSGAPDNESLARVTKDILRDDLKKKRYHPKVSLPFDLLDTNSARPRSGDIEYNKHKIKSTLQSFGIEVEMAEVNVGPTVTQYTLKPAEGVKLSQITTLQNDLSLSLAVHPIRIEAPIPGKSLVGIEIPNKAVAVVGLREVLESDAFKKRASHLMIALGKDVSGKAVAADLEVMPHLLVAGATGSGKSVCLNTIIVSLLYQNQMDDLKMIMIDPKRVELAGYNGVPHLLTPVITDVDKTINALKWSVNEMDRRYQLLSSHNVRNIEAYNSELPEDAARMPYLVIIIDELADLMAVAAQDVEAAIIRLAQMARAVGIHLLLSTQRPSVNVITGLIKANITSRIAFTVASQTDSRTILDISGAEKLLGKGDMLYLSAELTKPRRLQGAYVSDQEIRRVVRYLKEEGGEPDYQNQVVERQNKNPYAVFEGSEDGQDDLLDEAQEVIVRAGKASASLLQRRLRIGYARAARILDMLEERGVIGPADGAKPREVLLESEKSFVREAMAADDGQLRSDRGRNEGYQEGEYGEEEDRS